MHNIYKTTNANTTKIKKQDCPKTIL